MNIVIQIDIATTPEKLFKALTTREGLAGWFTPEAKAEPKVGGLNEFSFDSTHTLGFRVEALEPGRVVWAPVQAPAEWLASRLTFAAIPEGPTVELTFTHSDLPEGYAAYGFFTYCWSQYVRSLKLLLETGAGEPYGSPPSRAWHPLG